MTETRTTLVELPSGKIELVFNGAYLTLQFNADCLDCLPYCRAMCCRMRMGYAVTLLDEEKDRYLSVPDPRRTGFRILAHKNDDASCVYLDSEKSLCTIHESKPWACGKWHCSPEGKGDGVEYRDGGWLISPMGLVQQVDDKGTVVDVRGSVE